MKVGFKIIGLEDVAKAIRETAEKTGVVTKEEIRAAALDTEKRSKENLIANKSVVTGTLLRSMTTDMLEGGYAAEVGTVTEYAPYVEFGTRRSRAKPYLIPAYEEATKGIDEKIKVKVEK
jgi:HK97 gp10 family phage protein